MSKTDKKSSIGNLMAGSLENKKPNKPNTATPVVAESRKVYKNIYMDPEAIKLLHKINLTAKLADENDYKTIGDTVYDGLKLLATKMKIKH